MGNKKYRQSDKGKATAKKYRQSKKGKLMFQKANRKWYFKNKKKHAQIRIKNHQKNKTILHEIKINGCAICGYNKCDAALDFHHVNPEDKKFEIIADSITNKNFIAELNKCILLCANCHREKHAKKQA